MATEPPVRLRAATLAAGGIFAPILLGALEALHVDAIGWAPAFAAATRSIFIPCGPSIAFLLLLGLPTRLIELDVRAAAALQALVAAAFSAILWAGLRFDAAIVAHPAVWAALVGIPAAFALEIFLRSWRAWTTWIVGLIGLTGAAACWVANYQIAAGAYPEAHWALTNVTLVLAGVGVSRVMLGIATRLSLGGRAVISVLLVGIAGVAVPALLASTASMRHVAADTEVGRARLFVLGPEDRSPRRADPSSDAVAQLTAVRPFDLPEGFDLDDWDILFVASEAIRWDETSLYDPALKTTPNLVRWRERGAMEFPDAFAPSSGTLQSLASWFTMVPPACAELDLYKPHWAGRLRDHTTTVAELFAKQNRHTFWVGHNFRNSFGEKMFGFEQGFEHVERTPEPNKTASLLADEKTGEAAVAHIRKLAPSKRFFGFVMFSSPHFSYVKHYDDMPSKTDRERYRQEVRKADEQFGKLLDVLAETGRLDHTIVVLTADHGEEFRDHGATGHNRSVYDESIRVPLLVWLPGATAANTVRPIATGWILPWLLLHGPTEMREDVTTILSEGWGPMLQATDGAVVAEILRGERSTSAIVTPATKYIYEVAADRATAFDRKSDPKEKQKRFELTPAEEQILEGYRAARRGCERFIDTKERPPKATP